jgi:hypothetical protein
LKAGFIGVPEYLSGNTGGILALNTKKPIRSSKDEESLSETGLILND